MSLMQTLLYLVVYLHAAWTQLACAVDGGLWRLRGSPRVCGGGRGVGGGGQNTHNEITGKVNSKQV